MIWIVVFESPAWVSWSRPGVRQGSVGAELLTSWRPGSREQEIEEVRAMYNPQAHGGPPPEVSRTFQNSLTSWGIKCSTHEPIRPISYTGFR